MKKQIHIVSKNWINSAPLSGEDLLGKVVLVNFWTSSCINCLRTFPKMREWWNKYQDKKFLIVSIHTPQFEFEKDLECVKGAGLDNNIYWPIVLDNEYYNWNRFKNKFWPTSYLINKKGQIVYCRIGEGEYFKMEERIRSLLLERNKRRSSEDMLTEKTDNVCFCATPEAQLGYLKGNIINRGGYFRDRNRYYEKPKKVLQNSMALSGDFYATSKFIQSQKEGSTIYLKFIATRVDLALSPFGSEAIAEVMLDGRAIEEGARGDDVDDSGKLHIKEQKTYNLLKANYPAQGVLSISCRKGKFRAYNFNFLGCVNGCI